MARVKAKAAPYRMPTTKAQLIHVLKVSRKRASWGRALQRDFRAGRLPGRIERGLIQLIEAHEQNEQGNRRG